MSPGPWTFYQYRYGFSHVICDADGRIIASSIMKGDGPVMASAPMLLHALARIASGEGPAPELATRALEECGEREAIILADWNPARRPPKLRIVGTAT